MVRSILEVFIHCIMWWKGDLAGTSIGSHVWSLSAIFDWRQWSISPSANNALANEWSINATPSPPRALEFLCAIAWSNSPVLALCRKRLGLLKTRTVVGFDRVVRPCWLNIFTYAMTWLQRITAYAVFNIGKNLLGYNNSEKLWDWNVLRQRNDNRLQVG